MGAPQKIADLDRYRKLKKELKKSQNLREIPHENELELFLELKEKIIHNSLSSIAYTDNEDTIDNYITKCYSNRECVILRKKLKNAIPYHSIIYLVITSCLIIASLILWGSHFITGIVIVPTYVCVLVLMGSIGLFITTILSIKDWKAWLLKDV